MSRSTNYVSYSSPSLEYGYGNVPAPSSLTYARSAPVSPYAAATPLAPVAAGGDLNALSAIDEAAKPLLDQTEALSNDIFPNDGAPIVQGDLIRTKFGNAPLPAGNVLDPNVRAELSDLASALNAVVSSDVIDPEALNVLLEASRDFQLNHQP